MRRQVLRLLVLPVQVMLRLLQAGVLGLLLLVVRLVLLVGRQAKVQSCGSRGTGSGCCCAMRSCQGARHSRAGSRVARAERGQGQGGVGGGHCCSRGWPRGHVGRALQSVKPLKGGLQLRGCQLLQLAQGTQHATSLGLSMVKHCRHSRATWELPLALHNCAEEVKKKYEINSTN